MILQRLVVVNEDGTTDVPVAFRRGDKPTPDELDAHTREGHIYAKGPFIPESVKHNLQAHQLWICRVCGQMFMEFADAR